jgi:hypothetical protein
VAAQQAIQDANKGVVEAQRGVADAARATADAQRNLADAQRGVTLATQAVADAQKAAGTSADGAAAKMANLSTKFDALPPAAQAFVRVLLSLKPKLDQLRETAAAGPAPGCREGPARRVEELRGRQHGRRPDREGDGRLAERAGALVGSSGFGKDLETVGKRNVTIIEHVGNAAITLADALRHVIVAAGPLTLWLARLSEKGADWILAQAKAGRESGKLAAFLERTRAVMTILGRSAFNLAAGLLNIGHAATPLGNDLLDKFEKLTERFRAWTDSASGKNQIAAYFQGREGAAASDVRTHRRHLRGAAADQHRQGRVAAHRPAADAGPDLRERRDPRPPRSARRSSTRSGTSCGCSGSSPAPADRSFRWSG